jgi:rare lipoprotein A
MELKLALPGTASTEARMRISACDLIFVSVAILLMGFVNGCTQSTTSQPPIPAAAITRVPTRPAPPKPAPSQTVKASYYGEEFRGHRTASGERYDPDQLTAASKKLPLGSLVHVTNPENGRSVVVRINDHGPYVRGRSLDLSKAAARRLGLTRKGVGRVKIARIRARGRSEHAAKVEEVVAPAAVSATAHVVPVEAATLPPPPSESADAVQ